MARPWFRKGDRLSLEIIDTGDPSIFGKKVRAFVHDVVDGVSTISHAGSKRVDDLCPILELEEALSQDHPRGSWLIAVPRGPHGRVARRLGRSQAFVATILPHTRPKEVGENTFAIASLRRQATAGHGE